MSKFMNKKKLFNAKNFAICCFVILLFVVSVIPAYAKGGTITIIEPEYTIKYVNVTEYDFVTDTERSYQMSYREYDIYSDESENELYSDETPITPQATIPNDEYNWALVPNSMYSTNPYKSICSMYSDGRATAFIVGKRIAMTAAHCVYDALNDSWDTEAYILPHASANTTNSNIIANGTRVLKAIIPTLYKATPTVANDWAILIVEDDIGTANGVLPLDCSTPVVGTEVYVLGYPLVGINSSANTMHKSPGEITYVSSNNIRHICDTASGNSGSPVIRQSVVNGTTRYNVVAVHTGGNSTYNVAHRIDQFLVNAVRELDAEYD